MAISCWPENRKAIDGSRRCRQTVDANRDAPLSRVAARADIFASDDSLSFRTCVTRAHIQESIQIWTEVCPPASISGRDDQRPAMSRTLMDPIPMSPILMSPISISPI
jgi:hypothetical protein